MEEIKFLALPTASQLERQMRDEDHPIKSRSIIERYRLQQWRILQAQRKCAVIAVEIMRPQDFRRIHSEYQQAMRDLRARYEDNCVQVFSEKCERGL